MCLEAYESLDPALSIDKDGMPETFYYFFSFVQAI